MSIRAVLARKRWSRGSAPNAVSSEARLRVAFEASPVGIGLCDERGLLVSVNHALGELLDRPDATIIGRRPAELVLPEDRRPEPSGRGVRRARYLRPDGEVRWIDLSVVPGSGEIHRRHSVAFFTDVTEQVHAELALADSEANLTAVAAVVRRIQGGEDARTTIVQAARDLSGAGVAALFEPEADPATTSLTDPGSLVVTATTAEQACELALPLDRPSLCALVYRTGEALLLSDPAEHPEAAPDLLALVTGRSVGLYPVLGRTGTAGVLVVAWPERVGDFAERAGRALALLADEAGLALQQERLRNELEQLAITDDLTGLANRRGWDMRLDQLMASARRSRNPLTIAIADLDHFKVYNDEHGHNAGDEFLRAFARAARQSLREVDFVARWGGEEFALALPNCAPHEAALVLERLRLAVPEEQTCSFGHATWDRFETAQRLMGRADEALYAAKALGRNRVEGQTAVSERTG